MCRAALSQHFPDGFHQFWQQEKVILEKGIGRHSPPLRGYPQDYFDATLRRWMSAELLKLRVQRRFGDFALFHVNDKAVFGADESDIEPLLELVPLAADHDSISVTIG